MAKEVRQRGTARFSAELQLALRFCVTIIFLWLLPAASRAAAAGPSTNALYNLPGAPPYLLAHYMAWYCMPDKPADANGEDQPAKWTHWRWDGGGPNHHNPQVILPNGRRDIASVVYPLIGPYDSASRTVVRYHLGTMHAAGVSGITAIWYGPGSDTDKCIPLLLDEAGRLDMRVAICYEEKLNFANYRHPKTRADVVASTIADLTYICRTYGNHHAYLRRAGLPVIAQFNGYGKDEAVGHHGLTPDEWRQVFAALPRRVAYIRQNLDPEFHPPIAAAYVWWAQNDWPSRFAQNAATLRDAGKLDFFMTMVCPGFNDTGVWGWGNGPRVSKGYGVDVLKWTEDQALIGHPELVQLVTWNDFNESTCFEPTVQYRFTFLQELARWWSSAAHKPVDLNAIPQPFEEYRQSCSAAERAELPAQ